MSGMQIASEYWNGFWMKEIIIILAIRIPDNKGIQKVNVQILGVRYADDH